MRRGTRLAADIGETSTLKRLASCRSTAQLSDSTAALILSRPQRSEIISRTCTRVRGSAFFSAKFAVQIRRKFFQDVAGHVHAELNSESTHCI